LKKSITVAAFCFLVGAPSHAGPGTLTLACKGGTTAYPSPYQGDGKPVPLSVGLLVDFTKRTIKGFPFSQMEITQVTELMIYFSETIVATFTTVTDGTIDRVTGDVEGHSATYKSTKGMDMLKPDNVVGGFTFTLKCTPAQRMF
jgi:hypothetical protein